MATGLVVKMTRGDWYGCQREGHPEKYASYEIWKNDSVDWYRIKYVSLACEYCSSKSTYEEAIDWMMKSVQYKLEDDPVFHPNTIMPEFKFEFGPAFPEQ